MFEEMHIENNYLFVFEVDTYNIHIREHILNATKIFKEFHKYVLLKQPHQKTISILLGNNQYVNVFFCLNHLDDGNFELSGLYTEGWGFYIDFDLGYCNIEAWNEIFNFIGIKFLKEKLDIIMQL